VAADCSSTKGASSWQFGHQLPVMFTSTTLPRNRASSFETSFPFKSGKLNRNGCDASFTRVCPLGSVGSGNPFARASAGRRALYSLCPCRLVRSTASVPSLAGVRVSNEGRAPEKWLSKNLPSL
jgi:hypothetical protein